MAGGQLRIEKLFAFIAKDPADNTEGVVAMQIGDMHLPMVGADMERATQLWPHAERMAKSLGIDVQLVEFSTRTVIDTIKGE